jgi:hypothetical protein
MSPEEKAKLAEERLKAKKKEEAERFVPKRPGQMQLSDLEMSQALRKKLPPKEPRPKGAKVPKDEYSNATSNNHVAVACKWRDDPEEHASCPRFGERVPYFFAMVPECTTRVSSKCVPPYMLVPSSSRPLPLLLDRRTYLTSKFQNPITKIVGVMCDTQTVRDVFKLDRYERQTGFNAKTNSVKVVRPAKPKDGAPAAKRARTLGKQMRMTDFWDAVDEPDPEPAPEPMEETQESLPIEQ